MVIFIGIKKILKKEVLSKNNKNKWMKLIDMEKVIHYTEEIVNRIYNNLSKRKDRVYK